jgi:hypothetical protein
LPADIEEWFRNLQHLRLTSFSTHSVKHTTWHGREFRLPSSLKPLKLELDFEKVQSQGSRLSDNVTFSRRLVGMFDGLNELEELTIDMSRIGNNEQCPSPFVLCPAIQRLPSLRRLVLLNVGRDPMSFLLQPLCTISTDEWATPCPSLQHIKLHSTRTGERLIYTADAIAHLKQLPSLTGLPSDSQPPLCEPPAIALLHTLQNLTDLNLQCTEKAIVVDDCLLDGYTPFNANLTDSLLLCTQLKSLRLHRFQLPHASMTRLLDGLPQLSTLTLSECALYGASSILHAKKLQSLWLLFSEIFNEDGSETSEFDVRIALNNHPLLSDHGIRVILCWF